MRRFGDRRCAVLQRVSLRGIILSHETVRQQCAKFGQTYANALRRRRARPGDKWHVDEVFLTIRVCGAKTQCSFVTWCLSVAG